VGAPTAIAARQHGWLGTFEAMASPCEVHIAHASRTEAERVIHAVAAEAARIEKKYSRYLNGNVVDRVNRSNGRPIRVDTETARLLDYAQTLYELSEGRFDITSGVLRRVWRFDGGDSLPDPQAVSRLLAKIGWDKIEWVSPKLTLPRGMQIDLGGIGKEYAVDRAAMLAADLHANSLINFGGDLRAQGPGKDGKGWIVGIESLSRDRDPESTIRLTAGAIATSGDAHRYLTGDGKRYGHILDPRTGWPVENAPRSVTVCAGSCTDAGMLATFAMLYGEEAESFLESQDVMFWCLR
jgi:thiamine biosynthesis lipoprotein